MRALRVFEKFTEEGSDPIHDLGIGIFYRHDFKDEKEIYDWLIRVMPAILKVSEVPGNIIYPPSENNPFFRQDIFSEISRYVNTYVFLNGTNYGGDFHLMNVKRLRDEYVKMGYPKNIKESLNEKFKEDSDPIDDLGIGMMHQIKEWVKTHGDAHHELRNTNDINEFIWICAAYDKIDFVKYLIAKGANVHAYEDDSLLEAIWHNFPEMTKVLLDAGADINARGPGVLLKIAISRKSKEVIKIIKDHIKNRKIKESLNEKFKEDSDPIHDMGIGIKHKVDKFIEYLTEHDLTDWGSLDFHNYTDLLRIAAFYEKDEIIDYLILLGADTSAYDSRALANAAYKRNKKICLKLIKAGANIDKAIDIAKDKDVEKFLNKLKNIKESLNEKFTEDSDPIHNMGIGIKHKIKEWLKKYNVTDYIIHDDLTIDAKVVTILNKKLVQFPSYIQFDTVYGHFAVEGCKLKTMRGFPKTIKKHGIYWGNLWVNNNELTSLKYSPSIVEGRYIVYGNRKHFSETEVRKECKVGRDVQIIKP
jgi:hypothetical protein